MDRPRPRRGDAATFNALSGDIERAAQLVLRDRNPNDKAQEVVTALLQHNLIPEARDVLARLCGQTVDKTTLSVLKRTLDQHVASGLDQSQQWKALAERWSGRTPDWLDSVMCGAFSSAEAAIRRLPEEERVLAGHLLSLQRAFEERLDACESLDACNEVSTWIKSECRRLALPPLPKSMADGFERKVQWKRGELRKAARVVMPSPSRSARRGADAPENGGGPVGRRDVISAEPIARTGESMMRERASAIATELPERMQAAFLELVAGNILQPLQCLDLGFRSIEDCAEDPALKRAADSLGMKIVCGDQWGVAMTERNTRKK